MALKVIGAGLGRTGTLSLKLALEHLGFGPCHHMIEVLANLPDQLPKWLDVTAGRPDWDAVFDGYGASVDYPGCVYYKELAAHYPDAKIILSTRDPDSWFRSASETILAPRLRAMTDGTPAKPFFDKLVYAPFGERWTDRDFMIDYFKRWNAAVIAAIPAERLLIFEAKQGWEPLCAFLGVPVPDAPYPRVNSREDMQGAVDGQDGPAPGGPPADGPPSLEMLAQMMKARLAALREEAFGSTTAG